MEQHTNYEQLWYLANDGDELAYNQLIVSYTENYGSFFYRKYANDFEYAEYYSEFQIAMFKGLETYDNDRGTALTSYLHRCIMNRLSSNRRDRNRKIELIMLCEADLEYMLHRLPTADAYTSNINECVERETFIESLTPDLQYVLRARLEGRTLNEVAGELELHHSQIHKIREKLKTKAKAYGLIEKSLEM